MDTDSIHRRAVSVRRRAIGMTLVELLIALSITAVIGLAVSMMLTATVRGAAGQSQMRRVMVRQKVLIGRLGAEIRRSAMALDADDSRVALWLGDANGDGAANLSELTLIRCVNGVVTVYAAPDDLSPASDTAYDLTSTDFVSTLSGRAGSADFPGAAWCMGVGDWAATWDGADIRLARWIGVRFTVTVGEESDTAVMGAAMRSGR